MAWVPLDHYPKYYSWPNLKTLRWITWKVEQEMGKQAPYIYRWGKKVLIDPEKFQAWILTEQAQAVKTSWVEKDRIRKKEKKLSKAKEAEEVEKVDDETV